MLGLHPKSLVAVLLIAPLAVGRGEAICHDGSLAPEKHRIARSFLKSLAVRVEQTGQEATFRSAVDELRDLTIHEIEHAIEEWSREEAGVNVRNCAWRMCEALRFVRMHGHALRAGERIAMALASDEEMQRAIGIVLLSQEEFGAELNRAIIALHKDKRPDVRYGAGVLAKQVAVFCGRSEAMDVVAKNLLADEDPRVAACFGRRDAFDMGSDVVLERVVGRLGDVRACRETAIGLLECPESTVGAELRNGLRANVSVWRVGVLNPKVVPRDSVWESVERTKAWWDGVRGVWSFRPDEERLRWRAAVDCTLRVRIGEEIGVRDLDGRNEWRVTLRSIKQGNVDGRIRVSSEVAIRAPDSEGGQLWEVGESGAYVGWVSKGKLGQIYREFAVAPMHDGEEVRLRVRLWTTSIERKPLGGRER